MLASTRLNSDSLLFELSLAFPKLLSARLNHRFARDCPIFSACFQNFTSELPRLRISVSEFRHRAPALGARISQYPVPNSRPSNLLQCVPSIPTARPQNGLGGDGQGLCCFAWKCPNASQSHCRSRPGPEASNVWSTSVAQAPLKRFPCQAQSATTAMACGRLWEMERVSSTPIRCCQGSRLVDGNYTLYCAPGFEAVA